MFGQTFALDASLLSLAADRRGAVAHPQAVRIPPELIGQVKAREVETLRTATSITSPQTPLNSAAKARLLGGARHAEKREPNVSCATAFTIQVRTTIIH
jgi:hypothetical protein